MSGSRESYFRGTVGATERSRKQYERVKKSRRFVALAETYREGVPVEGWWASEKWNGLRGTWDGHRFLSRYGNPFPTPEPILKEFRRIFKDDPVDGELWCGRTPEDFALAQSLVRGSGKPPELWREKVTYLVFDRRGAKVSYERTYRELKRKYGDRKHPLVKLTLQYPMSGPEEVREFHDDVAEEGGEGLMLRNPDADYRPGRTMQLLKFVDFEEAEALVVGHAPGRGKYRGLVGALECEWPGTGIRFKVNVPKEKDRADPPPVGAVVTVRYRFLTADGKPCPGVYKGIRRLPRGKRRR